MFSFTEKWATARDGSLRRIRRKIAGALNLRYRAWKMLCKGSEASEHHFPECVEHVWDELEKWGRA